MLTSSSTRIRPAFFACAALSAALLVVPRAASAAGHGGGHGGGGHSGGGGSHASGSHSFSHGGGSSRGGAYHGGTYRGGAYHGGAYHGGAYRGGTYRGGTYHGGTYHGGAYHGGTYHGGGWHGGHYRYGWGHYPSWGWGRGWAPYYSSWWWGGGPSFYVVTGDGYGDAVDTTRYDDEWSNLDGPPSPNERVSEENTDVRAEPLPRPAGTRPRMRFQVTPADAAVYVDDRYLGAGEDLAANARGVVTMPGTHTITVARPGYKTKTVDITVRIGAPVNVVVDLER